MMSRHVRHLGLFVAGVLLSSCSPESNITLAEPLVGAVPISVSLQTSWGLPLSGLPRVTIAPIASGVQAVWEVEVFGCLVQSATASQAGSVIEIRLERGGNPLANCAPMSDGYRYTARVLGLVPGRYEVRFVDQFTGRPTIEIGRTTVGVGQYAPD